MKTLTTILLFLSGIQVSSQTLFVKSIDINSTHFCYSSSIDGNDNLYMCGSNLDSFTGELTKVNQFGMLEWTISMRELNVGFIHNSNVVSNGSQILVGGGCDSAAHIFAFDEFGAPLWDRYFDVPNSFGCKTIKIVPVSNNYYVLFSAFITGDWLSYVAKLDQQGNLLWSKLYSIGEYPGDMVYNSTTNELLFSAIEQSGTDFVWIDTNGVVTRSFRYDSWRLNKLARLDDTLNVAIGANSMFGLPSIFCISNSGNVRWSEQLQDTSGIIVELVSVLVSSDQSIYIGTNSVSPAMGPPAALIKLDQLGNVVWSKGYFTNTNAENSIYGINEYSDGTISLAGARPTLLQSTFCIRENTTSIPSCVAMNFQTTNQPIGENHFPISVSTSNVSMLAPPYVTSFYSILPYQTYDCVTGISSENQPAQINVFPNPARDIATFLFDDGGEKRMIIVTDQLGREIWRRESSEIAVEFPASEFPTGMYFYSVIEGDARYSTGKFLIEH